MDERYAVLFESVEIGPRTAPNRFWQTPHATGYGTDLIGAQTGYRAMKAEGGWGVVFTEATSLAPETDKFPYLLGRMWDAGDIRNARHLTDAIHAYGSLAGIELEYHSSMSFAPEGRGLAHTVVPVAGEGPLPLGYAGTGVSLELEDIERIQELHVRAALRAVDAGFDLLTFHCGHSASLFSHFLIPYYNTRTDEYGGCLENRARFIRETMTRIRAAVDGRAAVGIRFGVDQLDGPFGLGERGLRSGPDGDSPKFVQMMDDLVDYWDLIIGGIDWGQDAQSSRTATENHEAPYTGHFKQYTSKPVVNVGRFNNPDTMARVVRDGQCDFVGAARASISDPFLPNKIRAGRIEDIRECIGCNLCVSRASMWNGRIICTQNATIGEEFRRGWHPEAFTPATNRDRSVLVIGAGPAGMEAAIVLAKRGFEHVHLVEANGAPGGAVNWISTIPGRGEWRHVVEYRVGQLDRLAGAQLILNSPMTADDVLGYGAQIVIVATGSRYSVDGVSPYDRLPMDYLAAIGGGALSPEDVLEAGAEVGQRVVVIDHDGYFVGPGIAEYLARRGHQVTIVTPADVLGDYTRYTTEQAMQVYDLVELGVDVRVSTTVVGAEPGGLLVRNALRRTVVPPERIAADTVALVGQRVASSSLFEELRRRRDEWEPNGIEAVYRVGDCHRPMFIADAIFTAHRLAREIDSDDPQVPLPWVRERRLVGGTDADFELGAPALGSVH